MNFRLIQGLIGFTILGALVLFTAFPQIKPDWIQIGEGRGPRANNAAFRGGSRDANSSHARLAKAAEYILDEQWEKAIRELTQVVSRDPQNREAYFLRAIAWGRMKAWDKALEDVDTVLKLKPDEDAYFIRAEIKADQGQPDAALADLNEALRLAPNSGDALCFRGRLREDAGDYAAALADYRQAIELDDEDPQALNSAAWLLATAPDDQLRDGKQALKLAKKAVETAGGDEWNTLDTLAAAAAECGDFAAAVRHETAALKRAPAEEKVDLEARLKLFQARQPYRLSK